MKLYVTPLSHFSRKVRILLDMYSATYEVIDVGSVTAADSVNFADNPLMKVPVLVDQSQWLVESDHIAAYIVQKWDPEDRFQVLTKDIFDLNARAIMNGIMSEEVKVILARRTGLPTENYIFFDKALKSIGLGLAWLESVHNKFDPKTPKYLDFHLVCLWDHLEHYNHIPLPYENLKRIVSEVSRHHTIKKTAPSILKPKN